MDMKKYYFGIIVTVATMVAFGIGCQKDNVSTGPSLLSGPQMLSPECQVDFELDCETDIPHYASEQDFEDLHLCLESEYEAHNNGKTKNRRSSGDIQAG